MISEHAPFGRRGYFSSFALQGTQIGQLLAAAVFLPLAHFLPEEDFNSWGWRIPFLLSLLVLIAGYFIRRNVDETPAFTREEETGSVPESPIRTAFRLGGADIFRVMCMALMNVIPTITTVFGAAYATQKDYGIGFSKEVYLWIPVVGNIVAALLIPWVGSLSDRIGRRPPIIFGALGSGLLSFGYLWAIGQHNVTLAFVFSILMWGIVYQGYNATFPSFYPELFPTKTRVTSMAIGQNIGTMLTAFFPVLLSQYIAPPGSADIPIKVGLFTLMVTMISAAAAYSARETYRIPLSELGNANAQPLPAAEYLRLREGTGGRAP